jgi:RNA polymerase sigma factor (TIGR02999 family)
LLNIWLYGNELPIMPPVGDVTRILEAAPRGETLDASELLPLVYTELRRVAASKLGHESANHTLQPTALVHEAWLRMIRTSSQRFNGRAQFFAVAAEAMRRILVESARRKLALKRGHQPAREELDEAKPAGNTPSEEMLIVHEALERLASYDTTAAELVKLRYFGGMTMEECAGALQLPLRSTERIWAFARAWLRREIRRCPPV